MTLNEIEQRLSALKEEQDKLTHELERLKSEQHYLSAAMGCLKSEQNDVKPWRAETGEWYYFLDRTGRPSHEHEGFCLTDDAIHIIGNYYRTRELAEQDAKELALRGRVRQLRDALCEGYQFKNGEDNYFIYKDETNRKYSVDSLKHCRSIAEIYFDTAEHAQQACDILNAEMKRDG